MKKLIATTSIATAGVAAFTLAHGHDAQAAENNGGYNPQDPTSYSYSYTIDQQGNYHFTWEGNWSPERFNGGNASASYYTGYNATTGASYTQPTSTYSAPTQRYSAPSYSTQTTTTSSSYSSRDYSSSYTTTSTSTRSVSRGGSSANLYTAGQCTYYVFDRVGGKIGSTWGNANNWASAAASAGYTVNNRPSAGAILQTTQGAFGHVAYVESVNSDGSIRVSEMNYGYGPGVVTSRTISAGQAASYNYIH
ncbi:CHAP domain-containing protein [Staphylococcus intermedius]|uniref:Secretory antigen SsaA n=2 Tax=Staphylococcus TaxID=1279 RepID=A0A380G5E3_STAIN|nr:CHAP domain-containing protein [Staphylococcus intermedius]PCF78454.1 CHAP domain-containing protein [Staphylococcus intermedius]PCF79428.1 CHAP domain-containing protein [Staphylococcus intermedius]PCF86836.1 CHAP domain-containing protein [Staphylococcus intermedius]PCF89916.1 CHAP domain-containing protein [Staphylococcus intermedius]PNZ55472.1 CHAP domain-containing protein [Staphylococcus intermedius NCTC 11048]